MVEVATEAGVVRGTRDGRVMCWRGVPYAAAPVGARRFRPPEPPEPWTGVRDATRFGPAAAQRVTLLGGGRALGAGTGEDCLTLNIWAPARAAAPRPVFVWIHGGGFVNGSGSDPMFDGTYYATHGNVVFGHRSPANR